jgi:Protein of unknown function (DUF3800)
MPLCAYFDESGLHKPEGDLEWLVLGGAIASEKDWEHVSVEWEAALSGFSVRPPFHMKDFEFNHPPFNKLTELEHKALLNRLLDIQSKYVTQIFGVTNWKRNYTGPVRKIYTRNLKDILVTLAERLVAPSGDQLSVVFAKHPEVSRLTILDYFEDVKGDNGAFANCAVKEPQDCAPLQMADLIAYELSRSMRDGKPVRYPYRRMKETATITLFQLMEARLTIAASGRGALSST